MNEVAPAHNPPYIAAMRTAVGEAARDSAGGGVRNRLSRDDSGPRVTATRCPYEWAEQSFTSGGGDFTVPVIATSPSESAGVAGPRRSASDLVSPGWLEQPVCDPRMARVWRPRWG